MSSQVDKNKLRLRVAELIGYEMVRSGYCAALYFRGKQITRFTDDLDPDGWEWNSVDLDGLMPHLWYVMAKPYVVSTQLLSDDIWHAELSERHSGLIPDGCFAIGSSLAIAIGRLFFLACKAGLINPIEVTLS